MGRAGQQACGRRRSDVWEESVQGAPWWRRPLAANVALEVDQTVRMRVCHRNDRTSDALRRGDAGRADSKASRELVGSDRAGRNHRRRSRRFPCLVLLKGPEGLEVAGDPGVEALLQPHRCGRPLHRGAWVDGQGRARHAHALLSVQHASCLHHFQRL